MDTIEICGFCGNSPVDAGLSQAPHASFFERFYIRQARFMPQSHKYDNDYHARILEISLKGEQYVGI